MANKLLIVLAVAAALVEGYAAGGRGSFGTSGGTAAGKGDPEHCGMLMRGFIEEARKEDARNRQNTRYQRHTLDDAWPDTARAIIKLNRIEIILRRNGCPYLMDEHTGKGAPYRIGLPGEQTRPGVFVPPYAR